MREELATWLGSDNLTIEPLSGGSSNLTFRVHDRGRDLVLRRPPMSHVLATANDMKREWTVMTALHGTDVPVPEVVATCDDESVLGAPFYLTEFLDGVVFNDASNVAHLSEAESLACSFELMDVLARLHGLDPASVGLGEFGRPAGFVERQVRRWSTQWEKSKQAEIPEIDEVARRLAASMPAVQDESIVHGDYSFNNTMFFRQSPTRMQALLDWELSTLGDPLTDLGTVAVYWGDVGEMMWRSRDYPQPHRANSGFPSTDDLLERYAEMSGRDLSEINFYKTFAVFKLAVITAGAHARLVATEPDRAQHAGEMTATLARHGSRDGAGVSAPIDDPRLATLLATTASMTAAGQPFEVVKDTVLGEEMTVFANRKRSLREVVQEASAKGDGDCYVFSDGRRIRFDEVERQSASIAAALADRYGIRPGDHVALCAANCPEWIQLFWALASMNAVLVAMNGWWTAGEMRNALELTKPALVVMDEKRLARLDGDAGAPTLVIEHEFTSLLGYADAVLPSEPIDEDDPTALIFTSGTTGRPKAAVLSHRTVIGYLQLQSFLGARGLALAGRTPNAAPRRLAPFPLFHVSGFSATVSTLMGSGVTVWPLGRFDPDAVIELVKREKVTAWMGATTHIMRLLESPLIETLDASTIVQVGVGGSASTPVVVRRTEERFPHLTGTFSTGYGSTETGGIVSWAPGWLLQLAQDCVGPPLPTVEVRVTDESGAVVTDGVEGGH